ncbi:hypothetical protein ACFCZ6_14050 [Streptomyces hydrogenans]|uniref:hypothetical protein n=1 Tax=Streptomyces hydrogenans TaxID=1873719 RepID=UPI0035DDE840
MTHSYWVPLATFAAAIFAGVILLRTTSRTLYVALHNANSAERINAVAALLDATDELLSPTRAYPDLKHFTAMSAAVLRVRLFFDGTPVRIATEMGATAREMFGNVSRHCADVAVLNALRIAAEREEEEDERNTSPSRMAMEEIMEFRRAADEAYAAGEEEPDPEKQARKLLGWAPLEYDEILTAIGSGKERAERTERLERYRKLNEELSAARETLVDEVAVWLEKAPHKRRRRR